MSLPMHFGANKELILFARKLRVHMTDAEKILWEKIRNNALGPKFRNQHALYKFVVDFFCFELLLVIEVDGSIHTLTEIALNDKDRDEILKGLDIHILRFSNDQIFFEIDAVRTRIRQKIEEIENLKKEFAQKDTFQSPH